MGSYFELDKGFAIELPVWQAPNDYVLMQFERDTTNMLFKTWKNNGSYSKYFGVLSFDNTWALRTVRHRNLSYFPNEEEHDFRSYYLVVRNSSWLNNLKAERSRESSDWEKHDKTEYNHYVVQSHSSYIEIVSQAPVFSKQIRRSG